MIEFLAGAVTLGYLIAAGFFWRFWRKTADRLFLARVKGWQAVIRKRMKVTMSCDHRVIDGATAARFLQTMRDWLQTVGPTVPVY